MNRIGMPTIPFKVKVIRYWEGQDGSELWDGWFRSRVFAITGSQFLVYDNGEGSSSLEPNGFLWVDYLDVIPDCGNKNENVLRVELCEDDDE